MPTLEYFLVAESYSVDQSTNSVSVFNILDELGASVRPIILPKAVAISVWLIAGDETDNDYQVTLRVSGGGLGQPLEFSFQMTHGQRTRHRMFHGLEGSVFNDFGDVVFELLLNGEHRASHTLTLEEVPAVALPRPAEHAGA